MALFRRRRGETDRPATSDRGAPAGSGPRIQPLNEVELRWVDDHLNTLAEIDVDIADATRLGELYDTLLADWESGDDDQRQDPNPMINLIGLGLGEHLVRRTGLRWVLAADAAGAEVAVHGELGDVLIYPTNLVAKRWVAREYGFLPGLVEQTVRTLAEIRDAPGGEGRR